MSFYYSLIFFFSPSLFINSRIQMIVKSFSALLPNSSWEMFGYLTPILGSMLIDKFYQLIIFFLCPRAFHQIWVEYFLPSMEALDVCPIVEITGNFLPVSGAMLFDHLLQFLIFLFSPPSFAYCNWRIQVIHHLFNLALYTLIFQLFGSLWCEHFQLFIIKFHVH